MCVHGTSREGDLLAPPLLYANAQESHVGGHPVSGLHKKTVNARCDIPAGDATTIRGLHRYNNVKLF